MFIIFISIVILSLSSAIKPTRTAENPDVLESWIKLDKTLVGTTQSVIKQLMSMILESSSQLNLSSKCVKQSLQIVTGLRSLKKWAFSFVDASAKSFDGLLSGQLTSFGEYDQCLETIVFDRYKKDKVVFQGQYCMVQVRLPLPPKTKRYRIFDHLVELENFNGSEVLKFISERAHLMHYIPFRIGLCIPSGCTEKELQNILNFAVNQLDMDAQISYCEMKEEKQINWIQIFAIIVICCLIFLVIAGTWMEIRSDSKNVLSDKKLGEKILLSFSAINNFKRLFSTKTSAENFSCIHGLRFLTITWVVYGHAYLFPGLYIWNYRALFRVPKTSTEALPQMIINGSEAVDTFIFLAGLLVSYMTIKRVKIEKKKFNYLTFVIHRFWRIAPVVYFVLLSSFLIPLMGSGPTFHEIMQHTVYPCFQEWWRNLLFINNFFDSYKSCWSMTWFVSCDIQLYLISVIVVLPMIWFKKIGIMINILIIASSVIYTGVVTFLFDISPTLLVTHMNPDDEYYFFVYSYANTLCRAGPYFIGVFTGYILITKPGIKISKKFQIIGWCLATLSSGLTIFATSIWYNLHFPTPIEGLLYAVSYKVAFTAGVAWVTFCCITGYGGFINKFLSWKAWMPLGRLAFLTYLVQPVFQTIYIANFRTTQEFTHLHFAMQYFGFLCISMLLAFVVNLLVESPFLNLEKLLFESKPRTEAKPEIDGHNNVGFENVDITIKVNGQVEMLTCENSTNRKEYYNNSFNEKSEL